MRVAFPPTLAAALLTAAAARAEPPVVTPGETPRPPAAATTPGPQGLDLWFGADAILAPVLTPRIGGGVAPWVKLHFHERPVSLELGVRQVWTIFPAHLGADPFTATYSSLIFAGCWRTFIFVCPEIEAGRMSFTFNTGWASQGPDPSLVAAAGVRLMFERAISRRFLIRSMVELEGVVQPASFQVNDTRRPGWSVPGSLFTLGLGLGARL